MRLDPTPDRRAYGTALALLAVGGVLLLVGFGFVWAYATVPLVAGVDATTKEVGLAGRDVLPLAAASGWIALAGVAGIVATRGWGRSLVALVVLVAGVAGGTAAVVFVASPAGFIEAASAASSASVAPGWIAALVGGVCASAAAVWTLVRGRRWPSLGARYQRSTPQSARSAWDLQDLGRDPTDDLVE